MAGEESVEVELLEHSRHATGIAFDSQSALFDLALRFGRIGYRGIRVADSPRGSEPFTERFGESDRRT
jgi:hypothetical protein